MPYVHDAGLLLGQRHRALDLDPGHRRRARPARAPSRRGSTPRLRPPPAGNGRACRGASTFPAPSSRASTTCARSRTPSVIGERIESASAAGGRRLRLDRRRDRCLRAPEGMRGDDDRDGLAAPGARARAGGRPDLPRPTPRPRRRVPARRRRSSASRARLGRAGYHPGRGLDRDGVRRRRHRRRAPHRPGRDGGARRSTTASSSTNTSRPAPPASSRPATSRTRGTPSTAAASGSSTGPTRSTRGRSPPRRCSARK